jgi:L-ascorbate metabolism protein UlaG (beta-lactamase superfamily)
MALKIDLDRFIGIDDGVTEQLEDVKITGIAASHELLDRDEKTGRYPYMGYVVEAGGVTIFHAGDTCVYEGLLTKLKQWDKIDIMFLPINGRDGKRYRMGHIGNMTYQEAVDLAGALKPGLAVAGHWDMFYGNGEDPSLFADYYEAKYPGCRYWTGQNSADSGYLQYYLI